MRIVVICRPDIPIPPLAGYGGLQRNIYDFVQEIDRRNDHLIFLFASLDSNVSQLKNVTLLGNLAKAIWADLVTNKEFENKTETDIASQAKQASEQERTYVEYVLGTLPSLDFDVILVAYDNMYLVDKLGQHYEKMIWSIRDDISLEKKEFLLAHPKLHATAMSGYVLQSHPELKNVMTITWGINLNKFSFSKDCLSRTSEIPTIPLLQKWQKQGRDYLVMIAGIGAYKGQATAIKISEAANIPLIIAGTPQDHLTLKKTTYFKEQIKPYISDDVVYFGNADENQKIELFRFAKGSLALSGFEFSLFHEPFGRAIVESLTCGTPVIGYNYGSIPHIIKNGYAGFLFNSLDEAIEAAKQLDSIDRTGVRKWAEDNLSIGRVVDEYLTCLDKLISKN